MTTKWTKQDKDNGIYPAVGDVVKAVLGLHDEAEINVRGYSIDGKMVFGQCVKTAGVVICNVDWLHPIETERERYENDKNAMIRLARSECIINSREELAFGLGARIVYEKLNPFKEQ